MERYISKRYLTEKLNIIKRNMNVIESSCDSDEVTEDVYMRVKDDILYACKAIIHELEG